MKRIKFTGTYFLLILVIICFMLSSTLSLASNQEEVQNGTERVLRNTFSGEGDSYQCIGATDYTGQDETGSYTFRLAKSQIPAGNNKPGKALELELGDLSFKMRFVPGNITIPVEYTNSDPIKSIIPCWLSEQKVDYRLWKKVYDWALNQGYLFQNEGKCDEDFTNTPEESDVTHISWRDAAVWCNALTEYYNEINNDKLDCVYKVNNIFLKDSTVANTVNYDTITINKDSSGFRLPSNNEWNVAARYINGKKYYEGDFASGSDGPVLSKPTLDYDGNGQILSGSDILYPENDPKSGLKRHPNKLGIYGMSGGNEEWCDNNFPNEDDAVVIGPDYNGQNQDTPFVFQDVTSSNDESESSDKSSNALLYIILFIALLAALILFDRFKKKKRRRD